MTDQRINFGLVGLRFGRHMADQVASGPGAPYFRLAAVCDMDRALADKAAAELSTRAYYDLDALLADRDIPVIGLFTGPVGRAALIRRIIHSGRDVMTTKPFERDPAAALGVLQEAAALKRVVYLNSPGPTPADDLKQIAAWRREYQLGRPVAVRWETWASYREKPDGRWMDDPAQCPVAPIFRLGIYAINDLVAMLGEAESVQVMQSRLFTERPTVDNAQLSIRFRNGALANVFASFCILDGSHYRNTMTVNFENGTIYRDSGPRPGGGSEMTELVLAAGQGPARVTATARVPAGRCSGLYQWAVLRDAVQGRRPADEVSPQAIVAGLNIIDAMARAQTSGVTERVAAVEKES
jgi:predicted dehydrogenase